MTEGTSLEAGKEDNWMLSETKLSIVGSYRKKTEHFGGDADRGNTRTHPEHDG